MPYEPLEVTIPFGQCRECHSDLTLRVWGEGVDCEVWCSADDCDNKEIYR